MLTNEAERGIVWHLYIIDTALLGAREVFWRDVNRSRAHASPKFDIWGNPCLFSERGGVVRSDLHFCDGV